MNERKYEIKDNQIIKRSNGVAIPDDEPLFIFRAQDKRAVGALLAYQSICNSMNHKASIQKSIDDFRAFENQFPERMKEPDSVPDYEPKEMTVLVTKEQSNIISQIASTSDIPDSKVLEAILLTAFEKKIWEQ